MKSFNPVIDAMIFLTRPAWQLVNAFLVTEGSQPMFYYVFEKGLDKSKATDEPVKN